jgi:hypothetical protein
MLPNEVFALACLRYYEEQGLIVDKTNGEFAHCPLPRGVGDKGYYLLHEHHQQQGLLQSRDVGRKCFWTADVKKWLQGCTYWPNGYFELWDIWEEFSRITPDAVGRALETKRKNGTLNCTAGAHRKTRKKVEITFPNGRVAVFSSVAFASSYLGTSNARVSYWARGKCNPRKDFAGYYARYV